ncbi:type 1 glutamine amidotransferase [bacterium]|nr:type 1 glutamine amidotransferase [candidate division CSSED10-310 bacterium]
MSLHDKVIMIMVEKEYQILEVWYPLMRFREEGANIHVVGSGSSNKYKSTHGYSITVSANASEVAASDYDAVIVPGGWAPDYIRRHQDMVTLVREVHEYGGIVGTSSHGGSILVSSGLAQGARLTSFSSIRDDLVSAGAIWVDEPVVVHNRIVTCQSYSELPEFVKHIIEEIKKT